MKNKFERGNPWRFKIGNKINIGKKNTLGYHHTEETKKKIAVPQSGEKNKNWKGGRSPKYMRKTAPRPIPEKCESCGSVGRICFDHDHKTGKFRGWLCVRCNAALGMVNDDVGILISLIKYLTHGNTDKGGEDYPRDNQS